MHFVSGIPGVLFAGLFGSSGLFNGAGLAQLGIQLLGEIAVFAFVSVSVSLVCLLLRATVGIRVSKEDEVVGMDISEHHTVAYEYIEEVSELADELHTQPALSKAN